MIVDAYCAATERKPHSVARTVHGTVTFFDNLKKSADSRNGTKAVSFTLRIYDQIIARLGRDWPKDTPFPTLQDASLKLRKRRINKSASKDIAAIAG